MRQAHGLRHRHSQRCLTKRLDEVLIVQARGKTEDIFVKPQSSSLQTPLRSYCLGESGKVTFQLQYEGVYHICLGLIHNQVRLPGDYCTLIVSNQSNPFDRPLLEPPASSEMKETSLRYLCMVCKANHFCMRFKPCQHIVTCEQCSSSLEMVNNTCICPICHNKIESSDKVNFPL